MPRGNKNPTPRQPHPDAQAVYVSVYVPNDLAAIIKALPRGQRSKILGRWLMFGHEIERQFEASMTE